MTDVWILGATTASGAGVGAWVCPDAEVYATTIQTAASDEADGVRVGLAMAMLSVHANMGENLRIHFPTPKVPVDWLLDPTLDCHPTLSHYRLLYRTTILPLIDSGRLVLIPEEPCQMFTQLSHAIQGKEVFPRCTLLNSSSSTNTVGA